ncbi:hypothetical protein [Micromonospora sp. NBC_00421]|uniref:hypothetical protein n=1 Tax=Micromonospora sp. NBC_00421 TaxID=2975976 RepID=UPI002E1B6F67
MRRCQAILAPNSPRGRLLTEGASRRRAEWGGGDRATADAAQAAWRRALDVLDRLGHPDAAQVRQRLDGESAVR